MIVMKFGGSSIADAVATKQAASIVLSASPDKLLVVLSACKGITDRIIHLANISAEDKFNLAEQEIASLQNRHCNIINELIADENFRQNAISDIIVLINQLSTYCKGINLLRELTPQMLDYCLSFGEKLSTSIFHHYLIHLNSNSILIDADKIIKTNSNFGKAAPDMARILSNSHILHEHFEENDIIITQGFIGSDSEDRITTLGRGGSDLSAALLGAALNAKEIQIWTDVSGVMTADPRHIQSPRTIEKMTVSEIRELSFFGAKVLHPDTIKPAVEANIPVAVLNTFNPKHQGTVIVDDNITCNPALHSISIKKNCSAVRISLKTNINSLKQSLSISSKLSENNFSVLTASFTESSLIIFMDISIESAANAMQILMINGDYEIISGDLLCVVGSCLNSASAGENLYSKILNSIGDMRIDYVLAGTNSGSAFIFLQKEDTDEALNRIHQLIEYN